MIYFKEMVKATIKSKIYQMSQQAGSSNGNLETEFLLLQETFVLLLKTFN